MAKKRKAKTEDRRSRFERLGQRRMNRALTSIRLISNLSSSNYSWTETDVRTLEDALLFAISEMKAKFQVRAHKAPPLQFHFPTNGEGAEAGQAKTAEKTDA